MVSFLLWPTFNTKFKKKSNCFIEPRRGNFHRLNIDKQESQKVNFRWIQLTFLEEIEMRTAKQSFWIQPKIVTKSTEFFSWWNWAWSHCIWLADVMHHSFSFRADFRILFHSANGFSVNFKTSKFAYWPKTIIAAVFTFMDAIRIVKYNGYAMQWNSGNGHGLVMARNWLKLKVLGIRFSYALDAQGGRKCGKHKICVIFFCANCVLHGFSAYSHFLTILDLENQKKNRWT